MARTSALRKSTPKRRNTRSVSESHPQRLTSSTNEEVGSLQRGLAILDTVVRAERPLTSSELADVIGLSTSTTHRLLRSLSDLGYLFRDASKRYYPSARALFPTNLVHPLNVLRRNSMDELIGLRRRFGQAVALVVFIDRKRWVLETIPSIDSFSPYTDTEVSAPLHSTVAGKILLATISPEARLDLIGPGPYDALTTKTISTPAGLDCELANLTSRGYATSIDEMLQGLSAVGAPIWCSPGTPLGAVILSGASKHFTPETMQEMAIAVVHSAGLFSFASPDVRAACRFLGH